MKIQNLVSTALLVLALPLGAARAADSHAAHGASQKSATSPADAELIAKARASYPLKTCLVSDEPLGGMGETVPYIHRVAGQPDRVVFFCCGGCTDDFKADPAKFLTKVDAAAKNKPAAAAKRADGKAAH